MPLSSFVAVSQLTTSIFHGVTYVAHVPLLIYPFRVLLNKLMVISVAFFLQLY